MLLDRRRADRERRRALRIPAVFAVRTADGAQVRLGQAEDIACEGMALRWPKDASFLSQSPVQLTFELPGSGQAIAASALVVSDRHTGRFRRTGVRFTSLAPEHADLIARYCAGRA